jgi:hypothetical protein
MGARIFGFVSTISNTFLGYEADMIQHSMTRLVLLGLLVFPQLLSGQIRDLVSELSDARRVFVPVEDLDVIIERDKQGVLLPRAKFDVMLTQARTNAEKNAVPNGVSVVLTNADYAARVVGDQLLITVTAELTQFENDWRESRFALQRLALEQALVDDDPAMIGRHPDGSISLFTDTRGKHTLKLQLSTELTAAGSDQVAAFSLLQAPSGTFTLTLPAGKRLLIGNLQLERPAPLDQVADYSVAVGGAGGLQLRITDRAAENAADSLSFATTGYGLHVAPGEVTWHALTTLQVFGKPVDRLSFSVPRTLEIADVESTGLQGWELSDDPDDDQRTKISLTFGQAFDGSRKISLKGVMAVETGEPWSVPPLRIHGATSHIGQVVIQYPAGVRLRVEETAGVRRAVQEQKPAADMPDEMSKLNAAETLRFDVWQQDFLLRLSTQPKEREVQAAIAAVLDVNATGLDLQAALTVETHFSPLFELDIQVPAEWQVISAHRDNQPLKWQTVGLDEAGINQLRILLEPPVASGASAQIRLALRRDVEGWPVEADAITVDMPELYLPQSNLSEGAFVIRGDDDLDLEAFELTGLDPQPLQAAFERLRFQSQDTRFSGKLKITRKPSRIAVQTVTFGRIDPQTYHTFIQSVIEVQGGGVRSIRVTLPEAVGTAIRFECSSPRIVEQTPTSPLNGERTWTLQLDQRLRGQALILCDIELPRGELKEFVIPQARFLEAERQNGYLAVEAGGEQKLTIVANDASGVALTEVDPLDLPAVYYQPKERVVAVYRAPSSGATLTLSEQKFDKLPVPTAICPRLEISSILGGTGELQHRATFQLNTVGVQGLHVTLPMDCVLWATLVNGRPVEVRRSGDVYLVPLTARTTISADGTPSASLLGGEAISLQLYYRSEVAAVSKFGKLVQNPPTLTVESGQRTALPVEVLEQKWELHYPEVTRLIDSQGPLEPRQPLDSTSLFSAWSSTLRIPTIQDLLWQVVAIVVTAGLLALLGYGFRRNRLMTGVVFSLLVGMIALSLVAPALQSARRSARKTAGRAEAPMSAPARDFSVAELEDYKKLEVQAQALSDSEVNEPRKRPNAAPDGKPLMPPQSHDGQMPSDAPQDGKPQPAAQEFGDVAQRDNDGDRLDAAEAKLHLGIQQTQTIGQSGKLALLSLAIDFVPPAGSREKDFHYVGADTSLSGIPLEVDYVDRHSGNTLRVFVLSLVAMLGWLLRRVSIPVKIGLATLGILIPLAVLPIAPVSWQPVLDGVCLGTAIVVGLWIVRRVVRICTQLVGYCFGVTPKRAVASIALVVLVQPHFAAGQEKPVSEASPTTLIVPFDAGTEPLASERVFLSHEQFLQLYKLANPDKVSKQSAPQAGGVFEAFYTAKLNSNVTRPEDSTIEVTARYAVKSYVDGQLVVELPVGQVAARDAKLDGQAAALIAAPGCFKVAVAKPGLHVIDFVFEVPARISGATGSFTLPLLPVPAGKFAFVLPEKDLSVRVNGSSTIYRRVAQEEAQTVEFAIDKGGEVGVSWQPQQAQGAAAVVHVDSVQAVTITDAGTTVSQGFAYRIRQGGIADTSFTLAESLKLQSISGPDVGGWEVQGEGAARKLRVIFRRNVTDQTRLTIESFLDSKIGTESVTIAVPQIAPREITNEIGQVAIFAGNQFSLRAEQVESLVQVDSDKFTTQIPISRPNVAPQLTYRFSKRPFTLNLRVARQESQAHVTAQQGAFGTLRKQKLTTRLRYNLTGAPRSSLSVALPANFVLLDLQATGLHDYYVAKQDDGETLTIDLNAPRLGLIEVVLSGFTTRDDASSSITFPQPLDASKLETTGAIWLDEGFVATLESFDGWRSIDATAIGSELSSIRPGHPIQFAFSSSSTNPSAVTLSIEQSNPKLSANGVSMVTVTDIAVIYTLALQWQIDAAKTDTLTLTTPDWLAGKLDFQGPGVREATQSDAGDNRTRWTIHLRNPVSGRYFATATATLPPPTTEVLAPSLVFESEQKPVEPQRQYVLLINSSLSQLSNVDPSLVESVHREDVPVVVQKEFVDQATELVRVKSLLTAPKWSLHRFAQQASAPASINVADLTTVLSRDGTYRAQGLYTIKNRSRQFLAVRMPPGTELLSVFVAGQPSRAVTAALPSLKGESAQLIALPKTSAASLSFPVKIVWRGRLPSPLPKSARLIRDEFSVPAPQILSQQDDADYGIPVARTRWTVYLPEDLDAQPSGSTSKHNLSLSTNADNIYGSAVVQEADELLGFFEQIRESNRRVQTRNNLKQIGVAADNLRQLKNYLGNYRSQLPDAEFAKNKEDVLKRLSEVEKIANDESRKTVEFLSRSNDLAVQQGLTFQAEGLAEGVAIANDQKDAFIAANGAAVIVNDGNQSPEANFNFSLLAQDATKADAKLQKPGQSDSSKKSGGDFSGNRAQLQNSNSVNLDSLNKTVTNNATSRSRANPQQSLGREAGGQPAYPNAPNNNLLFNNGIAGNRPGSSLWNDANAPGATLSDPFGNNAGFSMGNAATSTAGGSVPGMMGGMPGGGGFGGGGMGGMGGGMPGGMQRNPAGPGGTGSGMGMMPQTDPNAVFGNFQNDSVAVYPNGAVAQYPGVPGVNGQQLMAQQEALQGGRPGNFNGAGAPTSKQPGGLSLDINLPTSGRKLVFTKAGGDPKLSLAVRPEQSVRWGLAIVWSAVWVLIAAIILLTLRKASGLRRVVHLMPLVAVMIGVLGFLVLPAPLNAISFVLFVIGMSFLAFRKRTIAV